MPRLYLHIGTHKTGSTAIQQLLWKHRQALATAGLLYPDVGVRRDAHHEIAWAAGTTRAAPDAAALRAMVEDLVRQASTSAQSMLLSSEEFEFVQRVQELALLKDHFEVKVIVYLRKQDEYLEAAYNQHVRSYDLRFTGSIYQFALRYNFFWRFDYWRILQNWGDVFGVENVIVRPYGTDLVDDDALADFLSLLPLPVDLCRDIAGETIRINRALHPRAIPYMARINKMSLSREQHQAAQGILRKVIPHEPGFRFLRDEEAGRFYESFESDNETLFRTFMGLDHDAFRRAADAADASRWIDHDEIEPDVLVALVEAIFQEAGRKRLRQLLDAG
jgi:hypothetical protein